MKLTTAADLEAALAGSPRPVLLHVLPEESWAAKRLPEGRCACVYEVGFLDAVRALVPDPDVPVIVYGAGLPSLESGVAQDKLKAAGYTKVWDFSGGISSWTEAGLPTDGTGEEPAGLSHDGLWNVDTGESVIRWTGRNLFNFHEGTLRLSGGQIEIEQGEVKRGECLVDMRSIACADLADEAANQMLRHHLADADFFLTHEFPEAGFAVSSATPLSGATPGLPNTELEGTLTLRGVTREIRFQALVAFSDDGVMTAQAQLEFDRTQWGANYGSGRLFAWLGKHVVNDLVSLHLKIVATVAVPRGQEAANGLPTG